MISGPELQRLIDSEPQKGEDEPMLDYMKRYTAWYAKSFAYQPPNATTIPTVKTTIIHTKQEAA